MSVNPTLDGALKDPAGTEFPIRPIGRIRTPFAHSEGTPVQSSAAKALRNAPREAEKVWGVSIAAQPVAAIKSSRVETDLLPVQLEGSD